MVALVIAIMTILLANLEVKMAIDITIHVVMIIMSIANVAIMVLISHMATVLVTMVGITLLLTIASYVMIEQMVVMCAAILVVNASLCLVAHHDQLFQAVSQLFKYTINVVQVMVLLKEADKWHDFVGSALCILAYFCRYLNGTKKKICLVFFLVAGHSHCATEQAVIEVCHQLYPVVHKVMHHWHECRLLSSVEPMD